MEGGKQGLGGTVGFGGHRGVWGDMVGFVGAPCPHRLFPRAKPRQRVMVELRNMAGGRAGMALGFPPLGAGGGLSAPHRAAPLPPA